jgi:hypothetical protein
VPGDDADPVLFGLGVDRIPQFLELGFGDLGREVEVDREVDSSPETATSQKTMWKPNQAALEKPNDGTMKKGSVERAMYRPPTRMTP